MLVDGARQTGKTYLIESFAQAEYDDYVRIVCSWYKMRDSSEFRRAPHRFLLYFPKALLGKPLRRGVLAQADSMRTGSLPNR